MSFEIPVLLICFNRPKQTRRVFEQIRKIAPSRFYIAMDGPRNGHPEDAAAVQAVCEAVADVDWTDHVFRDYSQCNLGCKYRPPSAISWVLEREKWCIILEDDCLPNDSFFHYCQQMLEHYEHDHRIMSIGGTNVLGTWKDDLQDYHFSFRNMGGIWGWATWQRSWKHNNLEMSGFDETDLRTRLSTIMGEESCEKFIRACQRVRNGTTATWDYSWTYSRVTNWGLTILPSKNLVTNIGFGANATHTQTTVSPFANLPTYELQLPLPRHPDWVFPDIEFDQQTFAMTKRRRKSIGHKLTKFFKRIKKRKVSRHRKTDLDSA